MLQGPFATVDEPPVTSNKGTKARARAATYSALTGFTSHGSGEILFFQAQAQLRLRHEIFVRDAVHQLMRILFRAVPCGLVRPIRTFSSHRLLLAGLYQVRTMKRKAESPEPLARKTARGNGYCSTEQKRDSFGNPIWPAPEAQIVAARIFLVEW
jgi:hypothetical protein